MNHLLTYQSGIVEVAAMLTSNESTVKCFIDHNIIYTVLLVVAAAAKQKLFLEARKAYHRCINRICIIKLSVFM